MGLDSRGLVLELQGKYTEAEAEYREALRLRPTSPRPTQPG